MTAGDSWGDPDGAGDFTREPTWPLAACLRLLAQLTNSTVSNLHIDPTQIHLTGLSMGGYGTWETISRWPGLFRTAVPICGGGDPQKAAAIGGTEVWAIHAEDDGVVPVDRSRQMILALRKLGRRVRFTEYPASLGIGHGAWVPGYADPGLLPWIFASPGRPATTTQAAAPKFSMVSGTYAGNASPRLSSETADASIRYTLNGTLPDAGSSRYNGLLDISGPAFVRAISIAAGLAPPARSPRRTSTPPPPF